MLVPTSGLDLTPFEGPGGVGKRQRLFQIGTDDECIVSLDPSWEQALFVLSSPRHNMRLRSGFT